MKVPVALEGAVLPDNVTVEAAAIHGYDSPGMICSEAELGLSHQSEIIMELAENAEIGDMIVLKGMIGLVRLRFPKNDEDSPVWKTK